MNLPEPGPIAKKAIEVALGFAAAHIHEEGGENRGKQVEAFLKAVNLAPGNPWCAAFCRHCEEKAASFLDKAIPPTFPDSGYCPDFKAWAQHHNLWIPVSSARAGSAQVAPGDMVLFYFAAKQRVAHAGLVYALRMGGVLTVEGNTGPERDEVQREGDGTYKKDRAWSEIGSLGGFVRLSF